MLNMDRSLFEPLCTIQHLSRIFYRNFPHLVFIFFVFTSYIPKIILHQSIVFSQTRPQQLTYMSEMMKEISDLILTVNEGLWSTLRPGFVHDV